MRVTKRNAAFQELDALKRNRTKRTHEKRIVVEGVIPINRLRAAGFPVLTVAFPDRGELSDWARRIVASVPERSTLELSRELMSELSDKENPSELIVVSERPHYDPVALAARRVVVIDRPVSPGNIGSTIRSCNAFGVGSVLISGHGADPWDPRSISASRGSVFDLAVSHLGSNDELEAIISRCRSQAPTMVIGSSAHATSPLGELDPPEQFVLIVGNETSGMTRYLESRCDEIVAIPMTGSVSSFNVSCAATVLLYELTRNLTNL